MQYFADRHVWEFKWLPADDEDHPEIENHHPCRLTLLNPKCQKSKPENRET